MAGAGRWLEAMRNLEAAFLIGVEGATEVWLVRHGDCYEGMEDGPDPPLSTTGRMQASRLAERTKRHAVGAVYASPARRAMETAHLIDRDVRADPRLSEVTFEVSEDRQFRFTESPDAVIERMAGAIDDIVCEHPGQRVVVVSHGVAITYYLAHVLRLEPGQLRLLPHYTSVSVVRGLGDRRMVGALGDTAHLE